jgi:hypothetical protein
MEVRRKDQRGDSGAQAGGRGGRATGVADCTADGKDGREIHRAHHLDVLEMGDHLNGRYADVQLVSTRWVLACAMRSRSCGVSG